MPTAPRSILCSMPDAEHEVACSGIGIVGCLLAMAMAGLLVSVVCGILLWQAIW